jgi:type I restriction enzyme S subunit
VEYKTLGEIAKYRKERVPATVLTGKNYIGVENLLQNRQGRTLSSSVPKTGSFIGYRVNDILIGNIRPYLKKIWLADIDGGTNGDVLAICINEGEKIAPKFLYYVLSSDLFFAYDTKHSKGGKMPRGDKNAVLKYPIPIPPPPGSGRDRPHPRQVRRADHRPLGRAPGGT